MISRWFWRRMLSELARFAPMTIDGALAQAAIERALAADSTP